jgi:hypothetical protein
METGWELDKNCKNSYEEKEIKNIKEDNTYFKAARSSENFSSGFFFIPTMPIWVGDSGTKK